MLKWDSVYQSFMTRARGYGIAVNTTRDGAWFNIVRHDLDYCFYKEGIGKGWSIKRAKRRAAKYLFSLPKLTVSYD